MSQMTITILLRNRINIVYNNSIRMKIIKPLFK